MKFTKIIKAVGLAMALIGGALSVTVITAPAAIAQTSNAKKIVDDAKAKGEVGETISGYLDVVNSNVSADVRNAVNEINIRRKSVYTKLARDQNVQIAEVARVSGEKLIAKASPGEKIMDASGAWRTAG